MALVELRSSGIDQAAADFDALNARLGDKRPPLTRIAELLHQHLEAAYTSEGALGGSGRWVPLTRRYGAWKHRHGPGVPILVGLRPGPKGTRPQTYAPSGRMRRQILAPLGDSATWRITDNSMGYTAQSGIAPYHQEGTRKMRARPPVDPPRAWLSEIDREFVGWLNDLIEQSGF
jgi:hypothetical protein